MLKDKKPVGYKERASSKSEKSNNYIKYALGAVVTGSVAYYGLTKEKNLDIFGKIR